MGWGNKAIYYPGILPVSEGGLNALRMVRHRRALLSRATYGKRCIDRVSELDREGFHIIVDSGIFTYLYGSGKQEIGKAQCDRLFEAWLEDAENLTKTTRKAFIVEWDAQAAVGYSHVKEYRKATADVIPTDRVIYVWHRPDGLDGLLDFPPDARVAISLVGDPGQKGWLFETAKSAAKVLRQRGHRIHLLGVSALSTLHYLHGLFDSFDSSSWCVKSRFGCSETSPPLERSLIYSGAFRRKNCDGRYEYLMHEYPMIKELERLKAFIIQEDCP